MSGQFLLVDLVVLPKSERIGYLATIGKLVRQEKVLQCEVKDVRRMRALHEIIRFWSPA